MPPRFMPRSRSQRRPQAGRQSGGPDALGAQRPAELGSDILPPAGAGEWGWAGRAASPRRNTAGETEKKRGKM